MSNNIMINDFVFGLIGFVGFESLKIYKRLWARKKIFPETNIVLYIISLIGVGMFSGCISLAFSKGNIAEALFIGFSVPTSIKAVFEPNQDNRKLRKAITVDDIEIKKVGIKANLRYWYDLYFKI